jgi:hypothetical protein
MLGMFDKKNAVWLCGPSQAGQGATISSHGRRKKETIDQSSIVPTVPSPEIAAIDRILFSPRLVCAPTCIQHLV